MSGSNPFATRFTRPGALDFIFPNGDSAAALIARLRENAWQGQIIGPHGSGKSTLLAALLPALETVGRVVEHHQVQQGVGLALLAEQMAAWNHSTQVVIDGFEQLAWLARRKIIREARDRGVGLLITAHADVGLPTLFQTQPTVELVGQIVSRLLPSGDTTITPDDIARAHAAHGDNLREMLFALFDVYQSRRGNG